MRRLLTALLLACGSAGCFPEFEDTPWLVAGPRILAVRGEPAEAEPLASVRFEALVATPEGPQPDDGIAWAYCLRPRTLAERNGVAPQCLADDQVQPLESRVAQIPFDACAFFGPNPPPSDPDEPPLRPADPDTTGGYYLPIRATLGQEAVAFGFERLRCALAGAPREIFRAYQQRYTNNQNPIIDAVELVAEEEAEPLETGAAVPAGAEVTLRVRWTGESAEPYVQYDPLDAVLLDRVESMVVSWFSSAGRFASERSGRSEEEVAAGADSVEVRWTVPQEPGTVHLWIVLRDERGGVDWRVLSVEAQ